MSRLAKLFVFLSGLIVFAIPIERRHDKIFRFISKALKPEALDLPKWFDKKLCFYPTDLVVFALFFIAIYLNRHRIQSLLFKKGAVFLWLIFLCSIVSIAFSPLSAYPIAYSRLLQLLTPFLFFCCLANAGDPLKLSRTVLACLVAAAVLQSIIALTQYLEQSYLGLHFLGEPRTEPGTLPSVSGRRWVFDYFSAAPLENQQILRRSPGTMPHCNPLGGFLCISLLASYSLYFSCVKKWLRPLLFLAISLLLMGICVTFSRAALFGWALGTFGWFAYALYQNGWKNFRSDSRYFKLLAAIVVAFGVSATLFHEQMISRRVITGLLTLSHQSNQVRIDLQNVALGMIQKKPLLGWGYHQYSLGASQYLHQPDAKPMEVHNIYLLLAAETGIISAGLFFLFLSWILMSAFRAPFTPEIASHFSMFLSFLFVGGCDLYPLFSQNGRLLLFGAAGLIASCQLTPFLAINKKESWKIFDRISPRYDAINRILSLKMDRGWRKAITRFLPREKPLHILDLATGTGDQVLALFDSKANIASTTGIDLSVNMVEIAKKKASKTAWSDKMSWRIADAGQLPFPEAQFDAATCSFGIRNFADPLQSLKEIHRILKGGGECFILEFSLPAAPFRWFYLFYLRTILPFLGGLISKEPAAYRYLNETIESFPSGEAFCALMRKAQFAETRAHQMAFGAVTLYIGKKS